MKQPLGITIALLVALGGAPLGAWAQAEDPYVRTLQGLRESLLDQERATNAAAAAPAPAPTLAALEQLFLASKITARQFQQYAHALTRNVAPVAPPPPRVAPAPRAATAVGSPPGTGTVAAATASIAGTNAPGAENPSLDRLAQMEAEMDRIIQEKAARDRAVTNQAAPAGAPKTKRERLNDLLRELITGKITEAQYKAKWTQITTEKE